MYKSVHEIVFSDAPGGIFKYKTSLLLEQD
jgi:hypothetical protein